MTSFNVNDDFWGIFPNAVFQVLVLNEIKNTTAEDMTFSKEILEQASKNSLKYTSDINFSQNPVIAQWREAFTHFKTKKGARSSIEALLKRANQGYSFSPINPLVDIYNSVSLSFAVPCGGEDIDKLSGDLQLGLAKGGEDFYPLGAEENSPALPGELIYFDNEGAVCRCLNWREAQRTMLTGETKNAVLIIESINEEQTKRAKNAINELSTLAEEKFQVKGNILQVDINNKLVKLI